MHINHVVTEKTGKPDMHIKLLVAGKGDLTIIEKPKYSRVYLSKVNPEVYSNSMYKCDYL